MPDTGAPWEIPYLDGTELVRAYPAFSEDLAEQVADGLSAAGGLVAVKHVLKTDTFSASVTSGDNVAVDDLEIVHEVADPANRLIITAWFGQAASSSLRGTVGIAVHDGAGLISPLGDASGVRQRSTGGGGEISAANSTRVVAMPSITFVHTPGAGSKTYTVRAINTSDVTQTLFVNREQDGGNQAFFTNSASALVIQEVKV